MTMNHGSSTSMMNGKSSVGQDRELSTSPSSSPKFIHVKSYYRRWPKTRNHSASRSPATPPSLATLSRSVRSDSSARSSLSLSGLILSVPEQRTVTNERSTSPESRMAQKESWLRILKSKKSLGVIATVFSTSAILIIGGELIDLHIFLFLLWSSFARNHSGFKEAKKIYPQDGLSVLIPSERLKL